MLAYQQGDLATAKSYLDKAEAIDGKSAEVNANKALVALAEGKNAEAKDYLMKATASPNYNEVLGNLQVAAGNYAQAAQCLKGVNSNKDYAEASKTLGKVARPDAVTSYLKAIVAARSGQDSSVLSNLKDAFAKDSSLKQRAAKDLEFATLFNDATFQSLVK